jgi:hypothetical protein
MLPHNHSRACPAPLLLMWLPFFSQELASKEEGCISGPFILPYCISLNIHPSSFVFSSLQFLPTVFSPLLFWNCLSAVCKMPSKKDAREHLRRAKEKGSEQCTEGINDSPVDKKPQDRVLWETINAWMICGMRKFSLDPTCCVILNEFTPADCRSRYVDEHPDASAYDLTSLKDFMKTVAFGIDGADGDLRPSEKTVMVYWKQFTAGWRRCNRAIPGNTTLLVTNVCLLCPLKDSCWVT